MRSGDRAIVMGLGILGLLAACWLLLLSPKRQEAAQLKDDVAALETEVAEQDALVAEGAAAKDDFDANYQQLVVLGKAVPEAADTSSLIAEMSSLSARTKLEFRTLDLVEGTAAPPAPVATETTAEEPPAEGEEAEEAEEGETTDSTATPVAATEASAAALPIGAAVGPAGLPVMPYAMDFTGGYFEFADFLEGLDGFVHSRNDQVVVDGRLLTVDGFNFTGDPRTGFPDLVGSLALSAYVTPDDQGLVGGASPTDPAATVPSTTTAPPAAPATSTPTASTP
jgi:Tfp pilus assembly protein PilO